MTSNVSPAAAPQDVEASVSGRGKIDKQPRRKRGAPKGNRNRFKTGLYTKEARALRKLVTRWKRQTHALLRMVEQSAG